MQTSSRTTTSSSTYYSRRHPEETTLYKAISSEMISVFREMEMEGRPLPDYVLQEFEAFLDCGILAKGFLRLNCSDCHNEKLVAFSCKKRGICPSCGGRRMCDTASHLVDNVFPHVQVRQWVLTVPFNLRYLFAYNKTALSKALEVTIRTINRFYLNRAKATGVEKSRPGSVTLIQRFGGSLNLNIHFHILYADGVWTEDGKFHAVKPPSDKDIASVVSKIKTRVFRALGRQGLISDDNNYLLGDQDDLALEYPGMAEGLACSIRGRTSDGGRIEELGRQFDLKWEPRDGELCRYQDGFSLHARVKIHANDRTGLEYLCRYIARPPVSNERLSFKGADKIVYKLKRPYNNGTTHLSFTLKEFIKKLIALVPPPRLNLTRYHGALGPNSKRRKKVVKKNKVPEKIRPKKEMPRYRISWAKLLKRVFGFEVDKCRCGGDLKITSAILDIETATGIMKSLKIPVFIPAPSPARCPNFFDSC